MKKRVADIIMDILVEHGITDCFAVVGGGAMFLDDALRKKTEINKVFNHHEQACAMAAEAYARYCGKPAMVCVTCGPGATNTLTGVMGAWQDSIPMIVLSGQVRYAISVPQSGLQLRYRGTQEFQVLPAVKSMTKYAVTIIDPLMLRRELVKAINISLDGRRGPVWIEVPQDIQSAIVEEDSLYTEDDFVSEVPTLDIDKACKALDLLKTAKRPCVLSGSGIRSSDSMQSFYEVVDKLKIPFVGASWVPDSGYEEHPLFYGLSGNIGPRTGNFILQNADVILALGNSLGFRQTGFNVEEFAPRAKIIMVDACEDEAKKPGLNIELFIHTDLKQFFDYVTNTDIEIDTDKEWVEYCSRLGRRFSAFEGLEGKKESDPVSAYVFWDRFRHYEEDDSLLALGNNTANSVKFQVGIMKAAQRVLSNYTCGSMGYDLPAAEGAAIASGKKVYCITGDGSIMMNLQELQTIYSYDMNIHVIVFNNNGYNAIRQTSRNFFDGEYIGCSPDTGVAFPDFQDIARTFKFEYIRCETNGELDERLRYITSADHRVFMEIIQDYDDQVIPKVMSRLDENGVMHAGILQDMYPFIDRDEYNDLML